MKTKNRVALITGAGSGIGRAAAIRLAREGMKVALLGRTEKELKQVMALITRKGGEALAVVADVSRADTPIAPVRIPALS